MDTAASVIEFFAANPMFFMLLVLAVLIIGWSVIGIIIRLCKKFKKIKIKKLNLGSFGVELDNEKEAPTQSTTVPHHPAPPLSEADFCDATTTDITPITVSFENFNMMVRHCVKVAIEAVNSKNMCLTDTLELQNKNAQALLDEVMAKVTRTYHDKKVKENISNGDSDPYKDVSILFFSDDFEEDWKNIVYPKLDQFFADEMLAFTDEVDLANMCKMLENQIIQAIEDKLNLKDSYAVNRQLAKDSFDACKSALSNAINDSLHKAKKISISNYDDIKKLAASKDEDLNSFVKACTQKEIKNNFISSELLERE